MFVPTKSVSKVSSCIVRREYAPSIGDLIVFDSKESREAYGKYVLDFEDKVIYEGTLMERENPEDIESNWIKRYWVRVQ